MGNKNVPFGIAIGAIVLVSGIALAGIYCQSRYFPDKRLAVVSVAKPNVVSEKMPATETYRNDAYGLEFAYSPEWGNIEVEEGNSDYIGLMKNGGPIFYLLTQENITLTQKNPKRGEYDVDFYDIPVGTTLDEWIIQKQGKAYEAHGDGYFSNKIGQEFDIAGLKTLHLVMRQGLGPHSAWDEFYFVKDGRLFTLTITELAITYDPLKREELKLDDESQWYTQLLKSFKVVDVR